MNEIKIVLISVVLVLMSSALVYGVNSIQMIDEFYGENPNKISAFDIIDKIRNEQAMYDSNGVALGYIDFENKQCVYKPGVFTLAVANDMINK